MTGNDLIKFFSKLKFNKEEEKIETFAYAKLEDDTVIQSDDFIVGNPIVKVLEDGTTEPLTDGEYIIKVEGEEGEMLKKVIIVEGLIDSIEDVVEPEAEETEIEIETETETEMEEVKENETEMEEDLVARILTLEERIAKLEELLNPTEMEEEIKVEEKEEELEKLDGAPIEKFTKITIKNKIESKQDKFLSKLYR